jgi:hypothetical protein
MRDRKVNRERRQDGRSQRTGEKGRRKRSRSRFSPASLLAMICSCDWIWIIGRVDISDLEVVRVDQGLGPSRRAEVTSNSRFGTKVCRVTVGG